MNVTLRLLVVVVLLLTLCTRHYAAEIASNGVGGGPWSDPASWRGKKPPNPDDDVVIQKNDIVIFDRSDDGKPTCKKLLIDPRGGLTFKPGTGKLALTVTDGIEAFGAIRLDGTKSAGDDFAIRLIGEAPPKRVIKLGNGGALLLYGRSNLPDDRRNVSLIARAENDPIPGLVECQGGGMIDWQRANIGDVKLYAIGIDNTGAKANERIKLLDNRFTGSGRIWCQGCDTPELVRNQFDNVKGKPLSEPAISAHSSPLADIKENIVHGGFPTGIAINVAVDNVVVGNTIEKCGVGIQGGYGVPNVMIKHATIRGCDTGLKLEGASGVVEDVTVEGASTGLYHTNSKLQFTNFRIKELAKKGVAIDFDTGTLSLLNCDVRFEDIKIAPQKPAADKPPPPEIITSWQYVIVRVKKAPPGSVVDVRTSTPAPPAGAADRNVRNSPAAVVDGLTPLPKDLTPLIVRAWSVDPLGKRMATPEYTTQVLGPAPKEGAARPVLATQPFIPTAGAYRAEPNDKMPTLEVLLK
jgi:hypothetical protein